MSVSATAKIVNFLSCNMFSSIACFFCIPLLMLRYDSFISIGMLVLGVLLSQTFPLGILVMLMFSFPLHCLTGGTALLPLYPSGSGSSPFAVFPWKMCWLCIV